MRIIALGHKSRVGKDTFASYLSSSYRIHIVRFAEPLYEIVNGIQYSLMKYNVKDPNLMQMLGDTIKKTYGSNVFVEIAEKKIISAIKGNYDFIIIPDLRYLEEYKMVKKYNAITININNINRTIDRDENHSSEVELDYVGFDYNIDNNFSLFSFYKKIDEIIHNIINIRYSNI